MLEAVKINWIENENWDFAGEDAQYLTHGLHPYPARMVPQIAGRLLRRFASKNDVALDPFCGSGGYQWKRVVPEHMKSARYTQ
jgi:DNA modification methylase